MHVLMGCASFAKRGVTGVQKGTSRRSWGSPGLFSFPRGGFGRYYASKSPRMATPAKPRSGEDPAAVLAELERFLSSCTDPVLAEPGEAVVELRPGAYQLHPRPPGCVLEVWGDAGGLVRRIVSAGRPAGGRLALKARRFGGGETDLEIVDRAAAGRRVARLDSMGRFEKFLARLLAREFPQHRLQRLTSSPDLQRSFSSSYVRGAILRGQDSWALMAAPPNASSETCNRMLTFGLLWLAEMRARRKSRGLAGLALFLPEGRAGLTLQRLPWLNRGLGRIEVREYFRNGAARRRELRDAPPLELELPVYRPPARPAGWVHEQVEALAAIPGVRWRARPDGLLSLEVGGLSFARASARKLSFGLETDAPATPRSIQRVVDLAENLARLRSPKSDRRTHPLYLARPEAWLAEQARARLDRLLPDLETDPIYTGVPAVLGRDRGILDLLGVERDGRLVVLELKASEDIHLPLQALDYWIRVRELAASGIFGERGYFAGMPVAAAPPRLLLVAPALEFHPQTDTLLRHLSTDISVERVGVSSSWRRDLTVEFRMSADKCRNAAGA